MLNNTTALKPEKEKINIMDEFIAGARKGYDIGIKNMVPNIVLAFTIIQFLNKLGIMDVIGTVFSPIMALFGLPGQAVTVLVTSWLAMGSGVGVAASLFSNGIITAKHVTILMPAIYLMGAQLNYSGRCLGLSGLPSKYWKWGYIICIVNALLSMWVMNLIA